LEPPWGIEPQTYALRVASAKSTSVAVPPGGVRRRVLPMIIYNWAGEAKAEFKTALAPAAIIVLMAITFLCNGVAVFPPESLRQAVVNAQLLLRADSR